MGVVVAIVKALSTLATIGFGLDAAFGGEKTADGRLTRRARRAMWGIIVAGGMAFAMVAVEWKLDLDRERTEAAQFTANLEGQGRILGQAQALSDSLRSSFQALTDSLRSSSQVLSDSLRSVGTLTEANLEAQRGHLERTVEVLHRLDSSNQIQAALLDRQDSAGRQLESVLDDQQRILSEQGLIDWNLSRIQLPLQDRMRLDLGLIYRLNRREWEEYVQRLEAKAAEMIESLGEISPGDWEEDVTWIHVPSVRLFTDRLQGATLFVTRSPDAVLAGRVKGIRLDSLTADGLEWFPRASMDDQRITIEFSREESYGRWHSIGLDVETSVDERLSNRLLRVDLDSRRIFLNRSDAVAYLRTEGTAGYSVLDLPGRRMEVEVMEKEWRPYLGATVEVGSRGASAVDFFILWLGDARFLWFGSERFAGAEAYFETAITVQDVERYPGEFGRFLPGRR